MHDIVDEVLRALHKSQASSPSCTPVVNVVCSKGDGMVSQDARACPPTELVKNGSFEEIGQFTVFRDWQQDLDVNMSLERNDDIAYEGTYAAEFRALTSTEVESKFGSIKQSVAVTPGCFLVLSFADNFEIAGDEFDDLDVAARVFYTDPGGNVVNLINLEIDYSPDQAGKGYVFHQRVSSSPVPFNVSAVTVEFEVQIEDSSGTEWLLDGVSLRAL